MRRSVCRRIIVCRRSDYRCYWRRQHEIVADGFACVICFRLLRSTRARMLSFALCSHLRRQSSYYRLSPIMPCAACTSLKSCRLFCPVLHFSVLVNSKGHWNLSAVAGVILSVSGHHDFVRISNSSLPSNNVRAAEELRPPRASAIGSIGNELILLCAFSEVQGTRPRCSLMV